MDDLTELIKTFVILLAIIDPIGNLPIYISLAANKTDAEHKAIILKTSCASVALLTVSFLFGKYIVVFFGIQINRGGFSWSISLSPCLPTTRPPIHFPKRGR